MQQILPLLRRMLGVAFGLLPALALANEATIRKVLEPMLGGARIESVRPAPVAGLYEVYFQTEKGARIVYTDARAAYVIHGGIYDVRAGRDLTEERLRKLSAIRFDSLPLDRAVKIQRGSGKRVVAMFSDPYCPACKQFERALQQVDDITIYVFMYPVIRPDLAEHSRAVWCSPDRAGAWLDLALRGKVPAAKASCETPVEDNLLLGRALRVNATPTLVFRDGERYSGGPADTGTTATPRSDRLDKKVTSANVAESRACGRFGARWLGDLDGSGDSSAALPDLSHDYGPPFQRVQQHALVAAANRRAQGDVDRQVLRLSACQALKHQRSRAAAAPCRVAMRHHRVAHDALDPFLGSSRWREQERNCQPDPQARY